MTIYDQMLKERQRLKTEIHSVQTKLKKLPAGRLICNRNGNGFKWYRSDGSRKNYSYIPKKNRKLAEQLAQRNYLQLLEEDLLQELKAVDSYLKNHSADGGRTAQLLSENPGYDELLQPCFKPLSQELQEWADAPYERNTSHPEQLLHKIHNKNFVRSKSEALIATLLYASRIPFRYECLLTLGDIPIHPDFTIRHPQTGQIYYWEHFGMMDNPSYFRKALSRLELYAANDIYPNSQLILTFETRKSPLSAAAAENWIRFYFL